MGSLLPLAAVFFLSGYAVSAEGIRITDASGGLFFKPEVNRSFNYCWNIGAQGEVTFNQMVFVEGGLFLGETGVFNSNVFAQAGVHLPIPVDMSLCVAYIFNSFSEYKSKIYTVTPKTVIRFRYGGFAVGYSMRMALYDDILLPMEHGFLALGYVNLYTSDQVTVRLTASNFHDFLVLTTGFYNLRVQFSVRVSRHITVISGFEMYQAGSIGLSATPYGGALTGGVVFSL
ncbi:MAG: hypothetical protein LBR47_02360 [Spirochaetaceae bacterium]|jgi:hypothetical protein|nr:hypothetical protein [Spirochaetaceae bacterium]